MFLEFSNFYNALPCCVVVEVVVVVVVVVVYAFLGSLCLRLYNCNV